MESSTLLLLPKVPALDNTFGAFMIGTFLGLILYGLIIHQVYRYFRLYHDMLLIRAWVVCIFILETFHVATCMHICYYYLVSCYFKPPELLVATWTIQFQSIICALEIVVAQCFFAFRVYMLGPKYKPLVAISAFCSILGLALAAGQSTSQTLRHILILEHVSSMATSTAATGISHRVQTFEKFWSYIWIDSAALGAAVVADTITTIVLCIHLRQSRTGFKRTDTTLDRLALYAINTGLLTSILNIVAVILLSCMSNLIAFAVAIIQARVYANSVLAVLNTRQHLAKDMAADMSIALHMRSYETGSAGTWKSQPIVASSEDVIEIKASCSAIVVDGTPGYRQDTHGGAGSSSMV
ncbi:hypothetical protein C8Q77DRAFT_1208090 [Trametes polyzona]|nr:hypothetical protein C8Q77DRAFT_1208090 [Trametes polyzona]